MILLSIFILIYYNYTKENIKNFNEEVSKIIFNFCFIINWMYAVVQWNAYYISHVFVTNIYVRYSNIKKQTNKKR